MNTVSRDVEDFAVVCMKDRRQICERSEMRLCASFMRMRRAIWKNNEPIFEATIGDSGEWGIVSVKSGDMWSDTVKLGNLRQYS